VARIAPGLKRPSITSGEQLPVAVSSMTHTSAEVGGSAVDVRSKFLGYTGVKQWSDADQPLPIPSMPGNADSSPPTVITPERLSTAGAVIELVSALDEFIVAHEGQRVPLDLQATVRPQWGAVFANLLAGRYAGLPLDVRFPADSDVRLQLARANVFFALARHTDKQFDSAAADEMVGRWSEDWEPADVMQPLVVLPDLADTGTVPQTLARNLVAFLNPDPYHNLQRDRDAVVHPWLRKLLGKPRIEDRAWRDQLYVDISLSTFELLDNIQDHADLPEAGLCSLSLFTTSGGSDNRSLLYLAVWDNGRGMPASIEEQYQVLMDPIDMVQAAVNGEMPHREADRGRGLNRVLELVNRVEGHLFIATGSADWREEGCVIVDHKGGSSRRASAHSLPIPVQGTVVVLTLPLSASRAEPEAGFRA
jgi:hypothetical protein